MSAQLDQLAAWMAATEVEYTRRAGLDRDTRKEILLKHITRVGEAGAPFEELSQVLPEASRNKLKVLLREIKNAGRAHSRDTTRSARGHVGMADE